MTTYNTIIPDRRKFSCAVCSAEWSPKKKDGLPKRCPRCKSKLWNTCYKHTCCKCDYQWNSASSSPDRCPHCQTKKWHRKEESLVPVPNNNVQREFQKPILLRYDAGVGCIRISADLGITFSEVFDIVKSTYPDIEPRL